MEVHSLLTHLPALESAIDYFPLRVAPDRLLTDVLDLMSNGNVNQNAPSNVSSAPVAKMVEEEAIVPSFKRSSCVLVVDRKQLVGLLTERDIVRLTAEGRNFAGVTIAEVMTQTVLTLTLSDFQDISAAIKIMRQHRIRHLPIVDRDQQLIGMVDTDSIRRILQPSNLLKLRRVREVMASQIIHAPTTASVLSLSQLMTKHRVSCVVITEVPESTAKIVPVGIVTERDIVQFQRLGLDLQQTQAANIMSSPLVTIAPEESLWKVQQEMERLRVRRLVVADHQGELQGIVTQTSMLKALDPTEVYGVIETLQQAVDKQTTQLQQINEKLQEEITQRQQTEAVLRESEQILKLFVENAPAAIAMFDREMRYLVVSQRWLTDYGLEGQNIIGRSHYEIFPNLPDSWKELHQRCLAGEVAKSEEIAFPLADGSCQWFRREIHPWNNHTGEIGGIIMFIERITERKLLEQQLEEQLKFEELLSTLSSYFINLDLDDIDDGIHYALQVISEFFQVDRSYIFLLCDLGKKRVRQNHQWVAPDISSQAHNFENLSFDEDDSYPWWADKIRQLQVCQIPDVTHLPPEASMDFLAQNIRSCIIIPIANNHTLIGAVRFDFLKPRPIWAEAKLSLLKFFGEMLANVLQRKWAEEERQKMADLLFEEKELAQVTLHSIGDAVITTDAQGTIQYFNPIAEQLTGWKSHQVKGVALNEIFKIVNETTREKVENPVDKVLRDNCIVGLANHTILIARDGTEYAIDDSAAPIRDRKRQMIGVVLVFHDVSEARQLERDLSWQATHDSLTGLVNRHKFEEQLRDAIASARHSKQQHALAYLDLDQFKVVNDTCGHVAGDELLRQVTHLLQKRVRTTDILARLGGDEFGLLLYQCPLPRAQQIVETLRQIIQDFRFTWDGKSFGLGASIGLVAIDQDTPDLSSLLSAADAACYAAKEKGRNCIHLYRPDDRDLIRQRGERHWIARINRALEEDRFCLYCQKIAPIQQSSDKDHYEVLIRLVDEQGKIVSPMAFIPAAERYDLMPAIDRWVISHFFDNYAHSRLISLIERQTKQDELYTINLSGASVNHPEFFSFIEEQFARHSLNPQNICFEITETTAITNLEQAAKLINSLKQLGCRFALDDFGSGMSSLAYLKNLPVDYLKIDGSFVRNIAENAIDYVMVESFNQISHVMGIQTIAEFVENESILQKLREIGVDYAQGYGIAKPALCQFN